MGDITTVEALFIEKSLADWTAVAGTGLFANRSDRLDDALARARELRARYLRKLLPPMQRAKIEPMDWFEALDIEIGRPSISNETLEDLLAKVTLDNRRLDNRRTSDVETANAPGTLLDFLISPPYSQVEKEERKARAEKDVPRRETPKERSRRKDRSAYSALQILDATPREMMDLGSALRELIIQRSKNEEPTDDEATPLLLSLVKDVVDLVREEQNFFTADEQNVLQQILPVRHYFPEDLHFKMDRLCLEPDPWPWKTAGEYRSSNNRDSDKLWIRKHRSWNLSVNRVWLKSPENPKPDNGQVDAQSNKPQQSPFNSLPPRPTAWIALLHDLAWTWSHDSITGNLIKRLSEELNPAPKAITAGSQPNDGGAQNEEVRSESEQDEGAEKEQVIDPQNDGGSQNKEAPLKSGQDGDAEKEQAPNPPKESCGWAVWRSEQGYRHFPVPEEFETFQQLDRFLRIWNSSFEWRDELCNKEQIDKYLENENLLYLWGVAGSVVLENRYESFAEREDNNWFVDQVTKFKREVIKEGRSGWPKTIYDFLINDMKLTPSSEGESEEG
jgi:hypothetical protein